MSVHETPSSEEGAALSASPSAKAPTKKGLLSALPDVDKPTFQKMYKAVRIVAKAVDELAALYGLNTPDIGAK